MDGYVSHAAVVEQRLGKPNPDTSTPSKKASFLDNLWLALVEIGNTIRNGFDSLFAASISDADVQNVKYTFAEKLTKVSSPQQPNPLIGTKTANKRSDFLTLLEAIKKKVPEQTKNAALIADIDKVIKFLNQDKKEAGLNVVENAYVSSILEKILIDITHTCGELEKNSESFDKQLKEPREKVVELTKKIEQENQTEEVKARLRENRTTVLNTIKELEAPAKTLRSYQHLQKDIRALERQALLGMKHLARERMIEELELPFHKVFKIGNSETHTIGASVGTSIGISKALTAEIALDANRTVVWTLDDEGYVACIVTYGAGLSAGVKADLGVLHASAEVKGDLSKGVYTEFKTSREFITYFLPEIIRSAEHRDNPNIKNFLSRSSILSAYFNDPTLTQSYKLWAVTNNESDEIDLFKKETDLLSSFNDVLHSLSLTSTTIDGIKTIETRDETSNKITHSTDPIKISTAGAGIAPVISGSFGGGAKAGVGTDRITDGFVGYKDMFSATAGASYTNAKRVVQDTRQTPFCQYIENPLKDDELNKGSQAKDDIRAKLASQFKKEIESNLLKQWKSADGIDNQFRANSEFEHDVKILLNDAKSIEELNYSLTNEKFRKYFTPDQFHDSLVALFHVKSTFAELLSEYKFDLNRVQNLLTAKNTLSKEKFASFLTENKYDKDLVILFDQPYNTQNIEAVLKNPTLRSIKPELNETEKFFNHLKQDFQFYTNIHRGIQARGTTTRQDEASLKNIENRYGASTKEQMLHRMVVANFSQFVKIDEKILSDGVTHHQLRELKKVKKFVNEMTKTDLQALEDKATEQELKSLINTVRELPAEATLSQLLELKTTITEQHIQQLAELRKTLNDHEKNLKDVVDRLIAIGKADVPVSPNAELIKNIDLYIKITEFEHELLNPLFKVDEAYLKSRAYYLEHIDFEIIDNKVLLEANFNVALADVKVGFECVFRERKHSNQLRDGHYIELSASINMQNGKISDPQRLMELITKQVNANITDPEARLAILDQINSGLENINPTATAGYESTIMWRFFKPNAFGKKLPYTLQLQRESVNQHFGLNLGVSFNTSAFSDLSLGVNYSKSLTENEDEKFKPNTFIYALMFGIHEYAILPEDDVRRTKTLAENNFWKDLKEIQGEYFPNVFAKFGADLKSRRSDGLVAEWSAISEEVMANIKLTETEKTNFINALEAFKTAAQNFETSPTSFGETMQSFEELMLAYSPHFSEKRLNSGHLLKPGIVPALETVMDLVATRRLQEPYHQVRRYEENHHLNISHLSFLNSSPIGQYGYV